MKRKKVLVTGGGTFLGDAIAAALLAEGAEVTLLVRPDIIRSSETDSDQTASINARLGSLADRARWFTADVWDPASLKGRGRGHDIAVHTVGGMTVDPAQGLTYHYLNVVSARNVANMCVSSGVGHLILMSAARAPWIPTGYIAAKREAETYLGRIGLEHSIIRAPLVYVRGRRRSLYYRLLTWLRIIPPFGWLGLNAAAPMPIDVLARGTARIALEDEQTKLIYNASDIRKRNTWRERRRGSAYIAVPTEQPRARRMIDRMDEDAPFGWTPPE